MSRRRNRRVQLSITSVAMALVATAGCAIQLARRSPWDVEQLAQLSDQLEQFKTLAQLKAEEAEQLRQAKEELEQRLSSSEVSVGYDERGLVTRMLDRLLFDSGKAELRPTASAVLDKVARVIEKVRDQPVTVEGHTDNEPIKRSRWKSNTELSVARARTVMDYLVDRHGISPGRLKAVGYGEARPIASNRSATGRQKNRRVEIVIGPQASGASAPARTEPGAGSGKIYVK